MTTLVWADMGGGVLEADGTDWTYLIASDSRQAVLTRFSPDASCDRAVARDAALNTIPIALVPARPAAESMAEAASYLQHLAQQYEAGIDVEDHPAWWHGYVPEGNRS